MGDRNLGRIQRIGFIIGQMEVKIRRKFYPIPLHRLIEGFGFHAVDFGEVGVEDHAFAAEEVDDRIDGRNLGGILSGGRARLGTIQGHNSCSWGQVGGTTLTPQFTDQCRLGSPLDRATGAGRRGPAYFFAAASAFFLAWTEST